MTKTNMKNSIKTALLLLALLLPATATAYDFEVGGIYYSKDGNEAIVVRGPSPFNNYSGYVDIPMIVTYRDTLYTVTRIGANAFQDCTSLLGVTIPSSVNTIFPYAFQGCTAMTSVTLGASVSRIGMKAFYNCTALTSITIPSSVTDISQMAFSGCDALTNIIVEEGNPKFDSRGNCNAVIETATNTLVVGCKNTTYPSSVTKIGDYAFCTCRVMTDFTIPNTITEIGECAFGGCSGLTSITIPSSITKIGARAFVGCPAVTTLNYNAVSCEGFESSNYSEPELYVPFYNLNITTINIGSSVQRLPNYFAVGLKKLTSITLPNTLKIIGHFAFGLCTGLTSVTIPSSVIGIGNAVFAGCPGLTSLSVDSDNPYCDSRGNCNAIIETATNLLLAGCKNTVIPNTVTQIGTSAFGGCTGLTSIVIPNSVILIGPTAFGECTGLTSIDIPNSVTQIWEGAFYGCTNMTNVTIGKSVTKIWWSAFEDCTSLTSVTIPNSVSHIYNFTFNGCTSLKSVTLGNAVSRIENYAFCDCAALTSVTCHTVTPPVLESYAFINAAYNNATLYVPAESVPAYQANTTWNKFYQIQSIGEEPSADPGDVNGDGKMNISDVTALINLLLSNGELPATADFNNDGIVNIRDVTAIVNYLLSNPQQ